MSVACAVDELAAVLLADPGPELQLGCAPEAALMLRPVDLARMCAQASSIADFYCSRGIAVHRYRPADPPPNFVFQADLFFMTPEGAILGRPAGLPRVGEERWVQAELARLGVPIRTSMRGSATFEGADALWLEPGHALVGVGRRTNREGAEAVAAELAAQGARTSLVAVPRGVQHLMGLLVFVDDDLAAVHSGLAGHDILQVLDARGVEALVVPPGPELLERRGMNFVTLRRREVVMPAGCPELRGALRARGVTVYELEIGEYLAAAGGLGCLTGVLHRRRPS